MNKQPLTADEIIKIDEQLDKNENSDIKNLEFESNEPVFTQHTLITSPWSRLGIIALPLGVGFLSFYFMFSNIMNGSNNVNNPKQIQAQSSPTPQSTDSENGDIHAKLALSQQEEQLNKIYQQKQKTTANEPQQKQVTPNNPKQTLSEVPVQKQPVTVASTPPPPSPNVSRSYSPQPQPRTIATIPRTRSYDTDVSPQPLPTNTALNSTLTTDPTEELNRLRSLGSFGEIVYNFATIGEPVAGDFVDESTTTQLRSQPPKNLSTEVIQPQPVIQNDTGTTIEKIRPRWLSEKSDKPMLVASDYLPQEAQILQQRSSRYLMVGEFANGVMVTPAMKQETNTRNPQQQTSDNKRFVAKLTEDLHDNYGQVAIPSGTMLAVELVSVDAGSYASLEVTSIIKDNTEYPISRGAISVLADGGKPLIAKKFQDKGGEIAQYDMTLGLVSGLGKIGEVLNESDSTTIINSSNNTYSSSSSSSSRRDIGGAFLEGAFGTLSNVISKRTETANTEIAARPNSWYIPKDTKITFMVNRTLELP